MKWLCALVATGVLTASAALAVPSRTQLLEGLPLRFEKNHSRSSADTAEYLARGANCRLSLNAQGSWLDWTDPANGKRARLRTRLLNARQQPLLEASDPLPGSVNYLVGSPVKWRTGTVGYGSVRYRQVYPGIDLVFHGEQGRLEYDFILQPHADATAIRLDLSGQQDAYIDSNGDLVAVTSAGEIRWKRPEVYQDDSGRRRPVAAHFVLTAKHMVGFSIGEYDRSRTLIIDPTLSYLTYLGGTKNDVARGIAVDAGGNAYIAGISSSVDLPVVSAFQTSLRGQTANFVSGDAFVAKFSPSGALLYLTYLGGSADDGATAIAVDTAGNAYVAGFTTSTDFPMVNPYQRSFGGMGGGGYARFGDAFVAKLNPQGTALIYSTYLGGNLDDMAMAIAVDPAGNAYVAGSTLSPNFPTTAGAVQTAFHGGGGEPPVDCCNVPVLNPGDVFVTKLAPNGSSLVFSTFLGGSQDDFASTLAVDVAGNVYVAGFTLSSNFPTTPGALQRQFGGLEFQNEFFHTGDGFISKMNADGTQLLYSTYLGGAGDDWVSAIAVDKAGDVYFTGSSSTGSSGPPLPVTPGVFQSRYNGYNALPFTGVNLLGDAIVGELNPAGSVLIYLTYLGGAANDAGQAIAIDSAGNAFVAGFTVSSNFPTTGGPFQSGFGGAGGNYTYLLFGDAFLAEVGPGGRLLLYSTYLGGSGDDMALGLALDGRGNVHLAGSTVSRDLKTTANATQRTFQGTQYSRPSFFMGDAFYAVFSGFAGAPAVNAVTNAASNAAGAISPGMIFVAYGSNLGPATLTGAQLDSNRRLSSNVAGAQMLFDGQPAPIVYASATQFSGIVPYSVAGKTITQVTSVYQGVQSQPIVVPVASAAPGMFSANFSGTGQAAAFNQDLSVNSALNPAAAGSIVVLFGTGEGTLIPTPADGTVSAAPPTWTPQQPISVTVGGAPATVLYANTAPQQVAGLLQINIQLSPDTPSGNQPVTVMVGRAQSQTGLTIAIQ